MARTSAQTKQSRIADLAQAETLCLADLRELLDHVNARGDDERRALARQLHDGLGSSLTAISMHLSLLAQKMPSGSPLLERTAHMKLLLRNVIETNRQMQVKLWNDKLEFFGVTAALGEACTAFGERHQIAVHCSLPEQPLTCPRNYGVVLLRALEEGLSNIAAHAQASEVGIILDNLDEAIILTLRDNGIGCHIGSAAQLGKHGLRLVRERVRCLGGALTVTPSAGKGTTLTVTLPKQAHPDNGL